LQNISRTNAATWQQKLAADEGIVLSVEFSFYCRFKKGEIGDQLFRFVRLNFFSIFVIQTHPSFSYSSVKNKFFAPSTKKFLSS